MLAETVKEEIFNSKAKKLLVAVSGGADSMVLLHILRSLDIEIVVGHVNYGLRGVESKKDEDLVRLYCEGHKIPFYCKRVLGEKPESNIQNWARDIRYKYFSEIESEYNTDKTIIAHNRNDFVENVVMNIIQGKSFISFKGIPKTNRTILRPLLSVDKSEIMEYARKNNVPFRHDESNFKNDYFRNYVRNDVIPALREINAEFEASIEKLTVAVQFLEDELSKLVEYCFKKDENLLVFELFIKYSRMIQIAILEKILTQNGLFDISRGQIRNALRLIESQVGKKVYIGSMTIYRERAGLKLVRHFHSSESRTTEEDLITLPEVNTEKTVNKFVISSEGRFLRSDFSPDELVFFTADKQVLLRKWESGDKMRPLGSSGFRKIKKILTDVKISSASRAEAYVLVEKSGRIIALLFPELFSRFGIISEDVKLMGNEEFVYRIKKASFE